MKCPACNEISRPGRRFCGACGRQLSFFCTRCGFENLGDEHFCGGCGGALQGAREHGDRTMDKPGIAPGGLSAQALEELQALRGKGRRVEQRRADPVSQDDIDQLVRRKADT